jgi:hypothetical protein
MQNYLQQPQYNYRPLFYKALPIANEAEMNNVTVDFNGAPTYFHNQMTNEIFVKQFDLKTGITSTQKFVRFEEENKPEEKNTDYNEKFDALNGRLEGLEKLIKNIQTNNDIKGAKNVK